jgi:hypothetical protein
MAEEPNIPKVSEAKGEVGPYKSGKLIIERVPITKKDLIEEYRQQGMPISREGTPLAIKAGDWERFAAVFGYKKEEWYYDKRQNAYYAYPLHYVYPLRGSGQPACYPSEKATSEIMVLQNWAARDTLNDFSTAMSLSPTSFKSLFALGGALYRPADVNRAIKILTQYERLAEKLGIRLSPARIAELNRLRDAGRISTSDLPAGLLREFPGNLAGLALDDIRKLK